MEKISLTQQYRPRIDIHGTSFDPSYPDKWTDEMITKAFEKFEKNMGCTLSEGGDPESQNVLNQKFEDWAVSWGQG